MRKPKVAFFDFACCEGCQLQVANLGEDLLDLLEAVEVVEFREVMSEKWDRDVDVAIIEGSITNPHAEERIRAIRERATVLVAYGSCATIGGVNGIKNSFNLEEIGQEVYGKDQALFPTTTTRAVHQVVRVDYSINGCPVYPPEFLTVLKAILRGNPYYVPDYAVCVECRQNENICMYDRGVACLGPVTRAGCNSWCVNNGNVCYGCRGLVSNPNHAGMRQVLADHGLSAELTVNKIDMYNKCRELKGV